MTFLKQNKSLIKKIIVSVIIISILISGFSNKPTFAMTAGDAESAAESWGGPVLNIIMTFFVSVADGAMSILQEVLFNVHTSLININTETSWLELVIGAIIFVGIIIIATGAIIATLGTGATVIVTAFSVGSILAKAAIAVAGLYFFYPLLYNLVEDQLGDNVYLPVYSISPYEIFSNQVLLFNVNFFDSGNYTESEDGESTLSETLYDTIASWYVTLRNIAIIVMLTILVYVGIRILLSSIASDKAKYKQFLFDWLIGMGLLFIMHYGMVFANFLVGQITDIVDSIQVSEADISGIEDASEGKISVAMYQITDQDLVDKAKEVLGESFRSAFDNYDNPTTLIWTADNFLQQARIESQLLFEVISTSDGTGDNEGSEGTENTESTENAEEETVEQLNYSRVGWQLIYVVLVIYTFIFSFTYLKRVIYMAFLTLIAPLVAITYPLDKMRDGKAQGFDIWTKEYFFNLLLQPLHLLLYSILIGSAMGFAAENPIYVIAALGFMIPAEKFLRRLFNFSKAETPGVFEGVAGGALMVSGLRNILGFGNNHTRHNTNSGSSGTSGSSGESSESTGMLGYKPANNVNTYERLAGFNNRQNDGEAETPTQPQTEGGNEAAPPVTTERGNETVVPLNVGIETRPQDAGTQPQDAGTQPQVGDRTGTQNPTNVNTRTTTARTTQQAPTMRRKIGKAFNAIGKRYIRRNGPPRSLLRSAVRLAGGVGIGAAGVVAGGIHGIVSGSAGQAIQTAGLLGQAGGSLGTNLAQGAIDRATGVRDTIQEARIAFGGEEAERRRDIRRYLRSDRMRTITENVDFTNREEAKNVVTQYINAGIVDEKSIIAAEKLRRDEGNEINTIDDAIAVAQLHDNILKGKTSNMKENDYKGYESAMHRNLTNAGMSDEAQRSSRIRESFIWNDMFDDFKNSINSGGNA